ncbi:hypothetical protein LCGC14_2878830, partial [marine sediment metagenome]
ANGVPMEQAYQDSSLKKFVEKERKEQEAANPDIVTSGQRLAPGQASLSREDFIRLPLEEQRKIVERLPAWGQQLPKGSWASSTRTRITCWKNFKIK